MPQLNEIIRSIVRQPKEVFFSSIKEQMDCRTNDLIRDEYSKFKQAFFIEQKEEINEETLEAVITETKIKKEVNSLLKSLKESYFDNRTILHRFRDGNTVAISPEDSNCLVQMHDSLNIMNQEKMRNLMSESFAEYNKILKFSKKHRKD